MGQPYLLLDENKAFYVYLIKSPFGEKTRLPYLYNDFKLALINKVTTPNTVEGYNHSLLAGE